jgi:hypothetical protein
MMKSSLLIMKCLIVVLTFILFVAGGSIGFAEQIYAQLSSVKAQLAGTEPKTVEMENVDANSGFDVSPTGVTIKTAGAYFIMVEGQAGSTAQNRSQAGGYIKLWIERNRKLVTNTVSEKYVGAEASAGTFVTQSVLPLQKGDTIGVGFSSNKPGAGLVMGSGEPKATSVGFTIFRIAQ